MAHLTSTHFSSLIRSRLGVGTAASQVWYTVLRTLPVRPLLICVTTLSILQMGKLRLGEVADLRSQRGDGLEGMRRGALSPGPVLSHNTMHHLSVLPPPTATTAFWDAGASFGS